MNKLTGSRKGAAALGVCALALAACDTTSGQSRRADRRQAIAVEIARPQRISVERQVDLSGTLLSPDQARVSSEVAGIVRDVPVQLGTEVRPGDLLVRIEPRELELALERAESALRQIEAQLGIDRTQDRQPPPDDQIASIRQAAANRDDARAGFARAQQLSGRGLLSQVDRETAETRLKVADANYQAALDNVHALKASLQDRRAAYDLARKKLNDAAVRAPVAGSVAERLVQPGEYIRENTPVVTIVQMSPLKLRTAIQEKHAAMIRPGQAVQFVVEAFPGRTFSGKIAYVSPAVEQTTRTFAVEAIVENAARELKPGFFAKGQVATHVDENVSAVPEDAISTLAGVSTVYVIENAKARQQQVALGERQGKLVEVVSGLKGDEVVAISNLSQLATGTDVRIDHGSSGNADGNGGSPASGGRGGRRGGDGRAAMKLADVSVRNPVFAIMLAAALLLLGTFSYEELGLDLMPKTDPPVVNINTNLPGASAEEIETQLTKPIEEVVNTISGIDELRANSDQGSSRVTINFTLEREIESAVQDVRDKVSTIVNRFPRDTKPPTIQKVDPDAQPILNFGVSGPRSQKELSAEAFKIQP